MATKKLGSVSKVTPVLITAADLAADVSGVLPVANGGNGTGTFTDGQILVGQTTGNTLTKVTLSGDVTMTQAGVVTIGSNKVVLAMMATISTASLLGRNSADTGNVEVLSASTVKTILSLNNVDNTSNATERAATRTLTNARITKRITTIASSATPTINTDSCDRVTITALAEAVTSMTTNLTGTPSNFDDLVFRIKDNGTARAITWGSSFEACGVALPTTTVANKRLVVGFQYDTVTSKWGCVASAQEA